MFNQLFQTLNALPVMAKAANITASCETGHPTLVASVTGSGKTLGLPTMWASQLNQMVLVLVPRRFLAINAAETVAELAGCEVGGLVGYAIGGDVQFDPLVTKVVYATYGYALSSRIIQTATRLVVDEVHEASMDIVLAQAILHQRLARGEDVKILEMSATVNLAQQAAYWATAGTVPAIFEVDGMPPKIDFSFSYIEPEWFDVKEWYEDDDDYRPRYEWVTLPSYDVPEGVETSTVENEIFQFIQQGKKGIAVFRSGVGEIERTAFAVREWAKENNISVEVATIYRNKTKAEKAEATAAPKGNIPKVLIGTNIIESGINILWLDAGISCGKGKQYVSYADGSAMLQTIDLPQWRIKQQMGRLRNGGPFVLCAETPYNERPLATTPEIEVNTYEELILQGANLNVNIHELMFNAKIDEDRMEASILTVKRLGLIDEHHQLTAAGKFAVAMPVGFRAATALWHAQKVGCTAEAMALAAIMSVGGLRADGREAHKLESSSYYLDALRAFWKVYGELAAGVFTEKEAEEICLASKVSLFAYEQAVQILEDLEERLATTSSTKFCEATKTALRRCILAGEIDSIRKIDGEDYRGNTATKGIFDGRYLSIGHGHDAEYGEYITGSIWTIQPYNPFMDCFDVVQRCTSVSLSDIEALQTVSSFLQTVSLEPKECDGELELDEELDEDIEAVDASPSLAELLAKLPKVS